MRHTKSFSKHQGPPDREQLTAEAKQERVPHVQLILPVRAQRRPMKPEDWLFGLSPEGDVATLTGVEPRFARGWQCSSDADDLARGIA